MVVAFIPVRGGSKSLYQKNVRKIAGKPLVCYAIEAALGSPAIDHVVVSTDADYIRTEVIHHFSGEQRVVLLDRSPETATDTASTESAMLEYASKHAFDHIILIQATSPLVTSKDISGGIDKYRTEQAGGLLSVVRQKRFIWSEEGGIAKPVNYHFLSRPRRQDFKGFLVENGAFYITSRQKLLQSGCRISDPISVWEMGEESYFELDESSDWVIIEQFLKDRRGSGRTDLQRKASKIKLLLTDVDGVLTDAGMYYSENGEELKKFNTRDGKAFELLRNAGIKTGIVTAEQTQLVERRAKKIKADFLFQNVKDKSFVLNEILKQTGLKETEIAYIGDDLNDVEIMLRAGISACPGDAVKTIKGIANITLLSKGGEGAIREFAEFILECKDQ